MACSRINSAFYRLLEYGKNPLLRLRTIQKTGSRNRTSHGLARMRCGAVGYQSRPSRLVHYVKGILDQIGVECHLLGPDEIKKVHPLLNTDGVLLGAHTTGDGHTDPSGVTNAMAIGAKNRGAEIYRNNRVTDINALPSGEWEVVTENGTIVCEHLVNAAGSFCSQVAEMVGLKLPMVNMVHQYLMTESIPEVAKLATELPVVRDPRSSCYYRQEQSGLIIGPYEMQAEAWGLSGIDWGFDNALLPPDLERLEPHLAEAAKSLPVFETAGIKKVVSGPITHTPDGNFLLGPAPGLRNHWMCCAASIGITQGPGCGKYLAQWMVHGQTEINVREMDPRRYGDWACGKYTLDKSIDEYEHMYATHYPGEFRSAGRPVRTTPIYEKLKSIGATVLANACGPCIGQWSRPEIKKGEQNTIVTSYNRNFPGRNDGKRETMNFIASPELVIALALGGNLSFNPLDDFLTGSDGKTFKLDAPESAPDVPDNGFVDAEDVYISPSENPDAVQVLIDPNSERLQKLEPFSAWDGKDLNDLRVMIKAKGKCTTDHISPAGPWLRLRGHLDKLSDNLLLGAVNAFNDQVGQSKNMLSNEIEGCAQIARQYKKQNISWVIVGDNNYGEGSSREHAAMTPRFLGCTAVIAKSFARIHETNLKKQGVLALTFDNSDDYEKIHEDDQISIIQLDGLAPGKSVECNIMHADKTSEKIMLNHSYNDLQLEWFKAGSAMNFLRKKQN